MSTQPVTHPKQNWINLLEHVAETGVQDLAPFADGIGSLVNMFAPGAGVAVSTLIKSVAQAEADAKAAGQEGNNTRKLSEVLGSVSDKISQSLQNSGQASDTAAVTAAVNRTVSAMKSIKVPSSGVTKVSDAIKPVTDMPNKPGPQQTAQASQQASHTSTVAHTEATSGPGAESHQVNTQESKATPIVSK